MLNNFISQTIKLLEKSNFSLRFPQICDTKIDGNYQSISFELVNYFTTIDIKFNFLLISSISFLLIDTYLDTIYSQLEGKSFKERYENIENINDIDIILKEIYRILKLIRLKLIRNATIHSRSAISVTNDIYIIDYDFRNTRFYLRISKKSFENLISLVLFIIKMKNSEVIINEYLVAILRTYYKELYNEIIINDEFSNQLLNISSSICLKNLRRYRVLNPRYEIIGSSVKIVPLKIPEGEREYSAADYIIEINSKKYLIPQEALINNTIELKDLSKWEYFDFKKLIKML